MKKLSLLPIALIVVSAVIAQSGINKYKQQVNYNQSFEAICTDIELLLDKEKKAFEQGEETDNKYVKYKRWQTHWRERLSPQENLPEAAFLNNVVAEKKQFRNAASRSASSVWQFVGPRQRSGGYWGMGRVTDIAFHPTDASTYFVGAAKGGIWKTTNAGASYHSLGDDLPFNSVGNIVVNQFNPNEIFISLGVEKSWWENGLGVYKSADGGASWQATNLSRNLEDEVAFLDMAASPLVEHLIFAACNEGLYKYTSQNTFELVNNGLPQPWAGSYPYEIAFHPTDSNIVYLAWFDFYDGNSDVFKSSDKGQTWTRVTEIGYGQISIATTPLDANKVVIQSINGDTKQIWVSNDAGDNWNAKGQDDNLEYSPICISPSNADHLYSGYFYIKKSTNDGASSSNIAAWDIDNYAVHVDQWVIKVNPLNNLMYWGNDGGVFKYEEAQDRWTELNNELAITQVYRTAIAQNESDIYYFGSQDNGGAYYRPEWGWINGNGGDAMNNAIAVDNSGKIFTSYVNGRELYRSYDGWYTVDVITGNVPNYAGNADWLSPLDLSALQTNHLVVATNEIFFSEDNGDTWQQRTNGQLSNIIRDIKFSPTDEQSVYATTASEIIETPDGGQTWNVYNHRDISRVHPHPSAPDTLFVVKQGFDDGNKVFLSANRGQNLINISGNLPNIPALCLAFDEKTDTLFLGTELGVYATDINNINWQPYGLGLPLTQISDLDIHWRDRKLVASTYGRGVWQINMDAQEVVTGAAVTPTIEINLYPNPASNYIAFSTQQNGVQSFAIYNQLGQIIQAGNTSSNKEQINISGLESGLYMILFKDQSGKLLAMKHFVKE